MRAKVLLIAAILFSAPALWSQDVPLPSIVINGTKAKLDVKKTANYMTPDNCLLVVAGTGGGYTVCPQREGTGRPGTTAALDLKPCRAYFGSGDPLEPPSNFTTYCASVARETPDGGAGKPAGKAPAAGTETVKTPITLPVRSKRTGPPLSP